MTQYTDADVARMLGWEYRQHWAHISGIWVDQSGKTGRIGELPNFFDPSPEADANTARYVIPFIEAQGWYFRYEIDCGDHVVTITDGETPELGYDLGDCFASTVCRAALQAWEAQERERQAK